MIRLGPPQAWAHLKPVTRTLDWEISVSENLKERLVAIEALASPGMLEALLREAIAQTFLVDIRARWLKGLPGAVNMQRGDETTRHNPRATPKIPKSLRDEFGTVNQELGATALAEHRARNELHGRALELRLDAINRARYQHTARLKALRTQIKRAALPKNRKPEERRLPKRGNFRTLALEILQKIADTNAVTITSEGGTIRAGIGSRAALDEILTPSSTPLLADHPTGSDRQIMWRQLEFGTGIYADPKEGGVWWYGKERGKGLMLRGTRGIHALFDPSRRLPYTANALRFQSIFFGMLAEALNGR